MNKIPHAVWLFISAFMGTLIYDYFTNGGSINWVRNGFVSLMMTLVLVYIGYRNKKNN
jgi:hypothetical protein